MLAMQAAVTVNSRSSVSRAWNARPDDDDETKIRGPEIATLKQGTAGRQDEVSRRGKHESTRRKDGTTGLQASAGRLAPMEGSMEGRGAAGANLPTTE